MDPLSITLAVVSLATAVKDMVELGQKIHESFAKVSNNFRNAQRVAEDIKEMVEEINVFYSDHKDALDGMTDFRLALQGLLSKFRSFEVSILPLLPQTGGKRRDRLIRGWGVWRNNNKIEESILDLQSNIVKIMRSYMMKSAMRTEVKLETIHQETSRGLTSITQGLDVLEVVRRDVSAIRVTTAATAMVYCAHESSGTTSDEFNRNVIMFAKSTPSTSAPMLRTPNVITEELMTTAYIKLQINSIVMTLEKISKLAVSAPNSFTSNSVNKFQPSLIFKEASMSIARLRHHVVREVTDIRDLLDTNGVHTISIYTGALALNTLSFGLETLDMGQESTLVRNWAITLARMLVDAAGDGQLDPAATLALYLLNQSIRYTGSGDNIHGLQTIEEAYAITQNLLNQSRGEARFQKLYSDVLLQYAPLVDNQRSIKMSVEAVQILENILNVQAFAQSNSYEEIIIESVVQPNSLFLDGLFSSESAPRIFLIRSYASALQRLGTYLFKDGHSKIALDLEFLAIAVCRKLVLMSGHEHKVQLALVLSSLVQGGSASRIPPEELVNIADECIRLLRELAGKNPLYYARQLVLVLWVKASRLGDLNRDAEAIATWEEVTSLAGQLVQDSELCATALGHLSDNFRRLARHDDAVRTLTLAITTYRHGAETQALRYICLSNDLQHLRRYKESADAARSSVALYRHLAMRDPGKWMSYLTAALSNLAHCLAASNGYSEALIAWKESVYMLDNFLNTETDASSVDIDLYLTALRLHPFLSYIVEDEEECLLVCSTAVRHLRRLSELYPKNDVAITMLLWAEFCHANNMLRVGRLQDAQQYIDRWPDVWRSKPESIPESNIMSWHATMVILKADVLDAQGCTEQALLATRKAQDIARLSVSTYQSPLSEEMIDSMVREARLLVSVGNGEQALKVAEGALRLSRDDKLEPTIDVDTLLLSLHAVTFTAFSCRNYKRATEAAREGCNIFDRPEDLKYWQNNEYGERSIFIRPSLMAFLSSAEANLGRCSTAVEHAHRAVDVSLEIRDMKLHISATTAEQSYMETRGNLADILLATGNPVRAREICEERSAYFSRRVEKRMGDYRDLAPVLRMLSVLSCSEGRHEEGDAAAKELSRIVRMLGSAFPSLQEQVKIRLRNQAEVPILKVLEKLSQKLDCGHQTEVVSLFAI